MVKYHHLLLRLHRAVPRHQLLPPLQAGWRGRRSAPPAAAAAPDAGRPEGVLGVSAAVLRNQELMLRAVERMERGVERIATAVDGVEQGVARIATAMELWIRNMSQGQGDQ